MVEDKEKMSEALTALEDWLYDEGDDVEKKVFRFTVTRPLTQSLILILKVYEDKHSELKKGFTRAERRCAEAAARPEALRDLRDTIAKFREFVSTTSEEYAPPPAPSLPHSLLISTKTVHAHAHFECTYHNPLHIVTTAGTSTSAPKSAAR